MRLAGKQEKKVFPEDVRETAWLSERDEKNIPENTRPLSALLRIEILHSGHMMYIDERGPFEHTSLASLTNIKANILQPCELSANWGLLSEEWQQQPGVSERLVWGRRQRKLWHVCVCMCQQQVWFSPLFSWNTYFTQGMQHMSCMLTLRGRREQKHVTIWGHMRVNWFQEVRHKWSFGHSTVTTNKFRLYSCRAHSLGCCKTLALGLIKTLITKRTG